MFDKKLWAKRFNSALPSWPCPACHVGRLVTVQESMREEETQASKNEHSHDAWEPSWISKRFSVHMRCSDAKCGEGVVVAGSSQCDIDYNYGYDGQTEIEEYNIYCPEIIHPSPCVISVPDETPEDIRKELMRASALIWIDVSSSANKLRLSAERILTALKVPKTTIVKRKRKPINLAARIDRLGKTKTEIADLLHSIRFLGNFASHEAIGTIDRDDLLTAFEIIEHVIDLAFNQKAARVRNAAKAIRKRKGKPKKALPGYF